MFTLCSSCSIPTKEKSILLNENNDSHLLDSIIVLLLVYHLKLKSISSENVNYDLDIFSYVENFAPSIKKLENIVSDINRRQTQLRIISKSQNDFDIETFSNWYKLVFDETESSMIEENNKNLMTQYNDRHFSLPKISFDTFLYERREELTNQIKRNIDEFNSLLSKYKIQRLNINNDGGKILDKTYYANTLNAKIADVTLNNNNIFKKYLEGTDNIKNIKDLLVKHSTINYDGKTYNTGYFEGNSLIFNITIDDKKPDIQLLYKNEIINVEPLVRHNFGF